MPFALETEARQKLKTRENRAEEMKKWLLSVVVSSARACSFRCYSACTGLPSCNAITRQLCYLFFVGDFFNVHKVLVTVVLVKYLPLKALRDMLNSFQK